MYCSMQNWCCLLCSKTLPGTTVVDSHCIKIASYISIYLFCQRLTISPQGRWFSSLLVKFCWSLSMISWTRAVRAMPSRTLTKMVHHGNLSAVYIFHNVFCHGRQSCTISLNAKCMVLFKNLKDKLQIAILDHPGNAALLLYKRCTMQPWCWGIF